MSKIKKNFFCSFLIQNNEHFRYSLRKFIKKALNFRTLLNLCNQSEAIRKGELYNLHFFNTEHSGQYSNKLYSYLRFTNNQRVLVVANFDVKPVSATLKVPANAFQLMGLSGVLTATDLLGSGFSTTFNTEEVANTKNKEKGIAYSSQVTTKLEEAGYFVKGQLVNFGDYGVPQKRTRFILVGIKNDLKNATQDKVNDFSILNFAQIGQTAFNIF
jgi:hypothetical protein